jgi:hypothetical protein
MGRDEYSLEVLDHLGVDAIGPDVLPLRHRAYPTAVLALETTQGDVPGLFADEGRERVDGTGREMQSGR